jgi:hypothetical protein
LCSVTLTAAPCPGILFSLSLEASLRSPVLLPSSFVPPDGPMDSFLACSLTYSRLEDLERKQFLPPPQESLWVVS